MERANRDADKCKTLVVCCDGTWNDMADRDGGVPVPTNVAKIYNLVAPTDCEGRIQNTFYHTGVGTVGGPLRRRIDGAFGHGLKQTIKSAYKWLAVNYRPGDRLFLFGFSRGAYTVRSLAGMIASNDLPNFIDPGDPVTEEQIWKQVEDKFSLFQQFGQTPIDEELPAGEDRRVAQIDFLGVWDTVGAMGIPEEFKWLRSAFSLTDYSFHDTKLSKLVKVARHALAMDERRHSFAPTLWTGLDETHDVQQLWFPGVHSDVGGGYRETGLADCALLWMIEEAKKAGLTFRTIPQANVRNDPHGVLHESWDGTFRKLRSIPRATPAFGTGDDPKTVFHCSAINRHRQPAISENAYWPSIALDVGSHHTIDIFARQHWNSTHIRLEKGHRYRLTASGEWRDRRNACGPGGLDTRELRLSNLPYWIAASYAFMAQETWFGFCAFANVVHKLRRRIFWFGSSKTPRISEKDESFHVIIQGVRRNRDYPWCSLVGAIVHGPVSGRNETHTEFLIGEGLEYTAPESGLLYCYANDLWSRYDNNTGSVTLTVERLR